MKTGKKIIVLMVLVFVFLPVFAQAVSWWPLVPCGTSVNPAPCNQCDLLRLLKNIIDFVLIGLMPPAAAILFVWGGFLILMGGANPGWITQGKTIFWNTAIGVAIISSSWLITNSIIRSIGVETITQDGVVTNVAKEWWKFECRVTTAGPPAPVEKKYACDNNQCTERSTGTFTEPSCNNSCGGAPPVQKYSCNQNNQCITDPDGQYSTNNCDNKCTPALANLTIATSSLSDARQDSNYSQTVQATGGETPYNWSVTGSLPTGLTINSAIGEIFGTPTVSGTFTFTVGIQDSSSPVKQASKQLSIKVVAPAASVTISNVASSDVTNTRAIITWTTDKPSTSQVEYGTSTSYGSSTPVNNSQITSHSVTISGLNPGTIYNARAISSVTGFTAKSSNNTFKTTGTATTTLSIITTSLSNGTQNTNYSQSLSATGGKTPYVWSVSFGTLPAGLSISGSNIIGKPTTTGTFTFAVKAEDSSSLKQSATKSLSIVVGGTAAVACLQSNLNLCQPQSTGCSASACGQYVSAINQYARRTGIANGANLIKSIMMKESACDVRQVSFDGSSFGLMQFRPSTANIYKSRCGIATNIDINEAWLTNPVNANASICLAAEYIKALSQTSCGNSARGIAAGYNGGSGACNNSVDCAGETSCAGGSVKRWECLYDNPQHTVCNGGNDPVGGYNETRNYATKVLYCYNNPGF